MNRTQAPEITDIHHIDFVRPKSFGVNNNVKLYCMTSVQNETSRFDLYFDAGSIRSNSVIPSLVNGLLFSGTKDKNSVTINEAINALGGYPELAVSNENAILSIYALKENLLPIARIVKDAIQNCVFDEKELQETIEDRKQKFLVGLEKVSVLAQRALKQRLFFSSDSYSFVHQLADYDVINRNELIAFHEAHYLNGLNKMVLVGNFKQDEIDEFMDIFGGWASQATPEFGKEFKNIKGKAYIEKEGALQTAIRLGKPLFNKQHEDYLDFLVLNTIIGDYFGSRLMSNIREDKGYTYGIGSMVAETKETGYFLIATEVGKDVREATLTEIRFELDRLKTELVSHSELQLVKNYMLGQLLKSADGPYSMMDLFLSAEINGKDLELYNQAIERIHAITPERIQELAKQYLNWDDFTIIMAG